VEAAGHPGKDAYLYTREVAHVYVCGTSDLKHKKDRDESVDPRICFAPSLRGVRDDLAFG